MLLLLVRLPKWVSWKKRTEQHAYCFASRGECVENGRVLRPRYQERKCRWGRPSIAKGPNAVALVAIERKGLSPVRLFMTLLLINEV